MNGYSATSMLGSFARSVYTYVLQISVRKELASSFRNSASCNMIRVLTEQSASAEGG